MIIANLLLINLEMRLEMKDNTAKRLNLNMPSHLVDEIDLIALELGLNRTSTIILMVNTYLNQKKSLDMIEFKKDIDYLTKKLADAGHL